MKQYIFPANNYLGNFLFLEVAVSRFSFFFFFFLSRSFDRASVKFHLELKLPPSPSLRSDMAVVYNICYGHWRVDTHNIYIPLYHTLQPPARTGANYMSAIFLGYRYTIRSYAGNRAASRTKVRRYMVDPTLVEYFNVIIYSTV